MSDNERPWADRWTETHRRRKGMDRETIERWRASDVAANRPDRTARFSDDEAPAVPDGYRDSDAYRHGLARAQEAMAAAQGDDADQPEPALLGRIETVFGAGPAGPAAPEVVTAELVPADRLPALRVPDPRFDVVPPGWWQHVALPALAALDTWDELDQAAGVIQAAADYIEALGESDIEYKKALRCVEARRGQLLGPTGPVGQHVIHTRVDEPDVSLETKRRWRQLAEHWDVVLPHLVATEDRYQVTQSRCLALIRPATAAPTPAPTPAPSREASQVPREMTAREAREALGREPVALVISNAAEAIWDVVGEGFVIVDRDAVVAALRELDEVVATIRAAVEGG